MARNCPTASADRKRKAEDDDAIHMVELYATAGVDNMDDDDDDETGEDVAIQDDGAASVLGSAKQSRKYLTFLIENGYGIHDIFALNVRKASSMATAWRKSPGRRIDVFVDLRDPTCCSDFGWTPSLGEAGSHSGLQHFS